MNPLLLLNLAGALRDDVREHPLRWKLLVLAPLLVVVFGCVMVLGGVLIVTLSWGSGGNSATPSHVAGIPDAMLAAYRQAAQQITHLRPDCQGMRWSILAGVAQEESQHANGHTIGPNGDITPPILGPELDGSGAGGNLTPIRNPDGSYARAEGPFQFLTTTWATISQDGNNDGRRDPQNAYDAALTAAVYLCGRGPRDLNDQQQLRAAIYSYNASQVYVDTVLGNIRNYDAARLQPPAGTAVASGKAKAVIDAAMSQLSVTYAWGGGTADGPSRGIRDGGMADQHGDYTKVGFDCSGLTLYAFAKAGIPLPHSSSGQFQLGTRVPRDAGLDALKPGDLVFYSPGLIHHVGIYLGNGQMINAPYSGTVVRVDSVDPGEYAGGVRLLA